MKCIPFPQATNYVKTAEGEVLQFALDGNIAIVCLQFSDEEIGQMKRYGNRLYIATPTSGKEGQATPTPIVPMIKLPLGGRMEISADDDNKD